MMNIVYSSTNSYAEMCGISLVSLFENNKDVDSIHIFIIDNGISNVNKVKLLQTAEVYHRKLNFIESPDIERTAHTSVYIGRWNIGTFFRLYLGSILPVDVERVIYIDCDIVVRKSLLSVYQMDLGRCSVGGVDDCRSALYQKEIDAPVEMIYMNNGFMVVDLKKWREEDTEKEFKDFIHERHGDLTYMDQAPLNHVLGNKKEIHALPAKYNAQRIYFDFSYKQLIRLRKPEHQLTEEEYNEAVTDPVIVHFTPTFLTGTRPWQKKDKHKFTSEYLHYKAISEWKGEPLRKDDRKFRKKVMTFICKITPKFILIPIMSYLHTVWYPKMRMKIAQKHIKENSR